MKVAVIGAGNGGQAIAGFLASKGHVVSLYDRSISRLNGLSSIRLTGQITCEGPIAFSSTDIGKVIRSAEIVMVATTATAHEELATMMAPHITDGQIIVLNPGRTGGAYEFRRIINSLACGIHYFVVEAQTLLYACRLIEPGVVNIIGEKKHVYVSAYPSSHNELIAPVLTELFPAFKFVANTLITSFENIGAIFHPSIVLFNLASIERNQSFYFYRDLTQKISDYIERIDNERLLIGKRYGVELLSASDWVVNAYENVVGETLLERIRSNPAYYDIISPSDIYARQIFEDVPTGLVPFQAFARQAEINTPVIDSLISICSSFFDVDFTNEGRNAASLGIENKTVDSIIKDLTYE